MKTDVVVIGGGPGGYVAAIRLALLRKKVVLVEEDKLGGICLNYGCIPSKAMIHAAGLLDNIKNSSKLGITFTGATIDFKKLQEWKNGITSKLSKGVEFLCRQNNVEVINGTACFESANRLIIKKGSEVASIEFKKAIIATGSKPIELPNMKFDGKKVISSRDALNLEEIPKKMVIIGGGYIGLELGTMYTKLGSKVSIVEMAEQILPGYDKCISDIIHKNLEKSGVEIFTCSKADKIDGNKLTINSKDKGIIFLEADKILVAVGRKPNTFDLGLDNAGVKLNERGCIQIDQSLRTGNKNIFAIGDVSAGLMLAHKASYQGKMVAELIAGKKVTKENKLVPAVVFTDPEIATVGLTEKEARDKKIKTRIGKFPFCVLGRSLTKDELQGYVKIIADEKSNKILGAEIIGEGASDLISEAALAIKMSATLEDLAETIHPHPTLSEGLSEAAEAAMKKAVHIMNPK
jgi:dihydrolipoamide dehydrogenase